MQTAVNDYGGLEWLELALPQGAIRIPVDAEVSTLIPFRGPRGSFRYISVTDVLHDRIVKEDLAGKIVLMGTSAPGLMDMRSTPVGGSVSRRGSSCQYDQRNS